jgi:flavin reductase (DIM6/NTAB) family NADH-FMN oxidoreductase RutF
MVTMSVQRPEDQRRIFRDAMGHFATGVTVITTAHEGRVHGMTANGFMSVSLDPQLIVVSIAQHATMKDLLVGSGVYGVSVLSAKQRQLSTHFAGRPREGEPIPFVEMAGVPLIAGALTRVAAHVVAAHPAGDHTLFVGEVVALETEAGEPLIFHGGGYRALEDPQEFTAMWRHATDWF